MLGAAARIIKFGWIKNRREMKGHEYARVSSQDQNIDRQIAALRAEGVDKILREKAPGNSVALLGFPSRRPCAW
jgi:hypothetical protein